MRLLIKQFGVTENRELIKLLSESHEALFDPVYVNQFDKQVREVPVPFLIEGSGED
jgi:hypothetical protein